MSDQSNWLKRRDAAHFDHGEVTRQLQAMEERSTKMVYHYEKLRKLEQLLRKRIKLYKDSPLDHPNDLQMHWRVQEGLYETLSAILKEAGLE